MANFRQKNGIYNTYEELKLKTHLVAAVARIMIYNTYEELKHSQ